jgi:hypothetical protein
MAVNPLTIARIRTYKANGRIIGRRTVTITASIRNSAVFISSGSKTSES